MAEEIFSDNLLRMVAAELHLLNGMTVAREMFGKSYFALGVGERATADKALFDMLVGTYQALTAEYLASQKVQQPMGFRAPHE